MFNNNAGFMSNLPPVVKNIIIINFILWLATLAGPGLFARFGVRIELADILGMHYWQAEKFNFTQMFSYMFMHGGFTHFFFNMFAVFMFGSTLEYTWGSRKFLIYYLITGVGAGIIQQFVWTIEFQPFINSMNAAIASSPESTMQIMAHKISQLNIPITVGASGSVFGILLAFGWLFPETRLMLLFPPIPIKAKYFVIGYGVLELFLGVANFAGDSIAHFAHLGGMLFGVIMILYWKKKGKLFAKN